MLIYRRPVCLFQQPIAVLVFMDPVNTGQKNFDHCPIVGMLLQRVKRVCQFLFSFEFDEKKLITPKADMKNQSLCKKYKINLSFLHSIIY